MTKSKVKDQYKVSQVFKNQKINQMNRVCLRIEKSQLFKEIQFKKFLIQRDLTHLNLLIKYLEQWKILDNQRNLKNHKYPTLWKENLFKPIKTFLVKVHLINNYKEGILSSLINYKKFSQTIM